MRTGVSLEDLKGPVSVRGVVNIIRGGRVMRTDVPVSGMKLEWSKTRDVPGQLTYDAPEDWTPIEPLSPLNFYGQRSEAWVVYTTTDGVDHPVHLGQFIHTGWASSEGKVSVTAADLFQVLEEDPMMWPSSPKTGATVRDELQRLAGTIPVVLDTGVPNAPVPRTAQWGTSRLGAIKSLAGANGFDVRMEADACLHAFPIRDARYTDAIYTMADLLINAPRMMPTTRRPNRWYAVGTKTDSTTDKSGESVQVEQKWSATATNTEDPFAPSEYGWVTQRVEASSADSQNSVSSVLNAQMATDLSSLTSRSVEIVPDGRIEVGDILGFVTDEETFAGRVIAYTLPVSDVGSAMRVDIEELEW